MFILRYHVRVCIEAAFPLPIKVQLHGLAREDARLFESTSRFRIYSHDIRLLMWSFNTVRLPYQN